MRMEEEQVLASGEVKTKFTTSFTKSHTVLYFFECGPGPCPNSIHLSRKQSFVCCPHSHPAETHLTAITIPSISLLHRCFIAPCFSILSSISSTPRFGAEFETFFSKVSHPISACFESPTPIVTVLTTVHHKQDSSLDSLQFNLPKA